MTISYSKNFVKEAKKLSKQQRQKLLERIEIFNDNPLNPTLRNHQLKGSYKTYRSIDITGDVRALYLQQEDEIIFDTVGTHSQLYGQSDTVRKSPPMASHVRFSSHFRTIKNTICLEKLIESQRMD